MKQQAGNSAGESETGDVCTPAQVFAVVCVSVLPVANEYESVGSSNTSC